ncbi:MAG: Uncharacterised protein [Flavobacterium sp. SCGC AAA160-P02]|nr:MAG: Uncharacterised protein [Flavobacterium sp. SCGC AAA160-P02]
MSRNQNNNEEEVDLGSLFVIIGKGFKKFFNFIGTVCIGIFHRFILILIFLRVHLKKFIIAALIGGSIGVIMENYKENKYASNLIVQPNFESTQQLYKNIAYYNNLIKQEKLDQLALTFNIDTTKASSLKKFNITPIINKNDIINAYDEFILDADTLTVKSYDFQEFENSFTDFDYLNHNIEVEATQSDVFSDLEDAIIESVEKNHYFERIKILTKENLSTRDSILRVSFNEVDSLRSVYMRALIEGAKNSSNGTNIDLGGNNETAKENELFEIDRRIIYDLNETYEKIAEKSDVINIISKFQSIGSEVKGIQKNYVFILAGISIMLTLFCILLLELNTYLTNYKKE